VFSRGVHMLRTVSLPQQPDPAAQALVNSLYLYESTGNLRQNQLITNVNSRFSKRISLFGFYMLNYARGDTDGVGTYPATRNYALEYGPTAYDIRHRVFIGGSVTAPWNIMFNPFITANTGAPYNITTGLDNNGDTIFNDRPSFAIPGSPNAKATPLGVYNLNPGPNDTIIPRNYGRGPGQFTINMRMSRTWGFGKRAEASTNDFGAGGGGGGPRGGGGRGGGGPRGGGFGGFGGGGMRGGFGGVSTGKRFNLTLSVSARNLLNHVNLAAPVGNLSSPLVGESLSIAGGGFGPGGGGPGGGGPGGAGASSNRRIDLSLRFSF